MEIKDQTFTNKTLRFDGDDDYTDCNFIDCEFVYGGGSTRRFTNCRFRGTRYTFDGCAANTVKFMTELYSVGAADVMERTFDNIRKGGGTGPLRLNLPKGIIH